LIITEKNYSHKKYYYSRLSVELVAAWKEPYKNDRYIIYFHKANLFDKFNDVFKKFGKYVKVIDNNRLSLFEFRGVRDEMDRTYRY
jgi:hypothetical protein